MDAPFEFEHPTWTAKPVPESAAVILNGIIDRYIPNCTEEERIEAQKDLYRFVEWEFRTAVRMVREGGDLK